MDKDVLVVGPAAASETGINLRPSRPAPSDELVDRWFAEAFHNIGLPVELYNRFYAAKETLKERLRAAKE